MIVESYEAITATIALTLGASWASGINLYAVLVVLGLGGVTGNIDLPSGLEVLENPLVIGAAGLMYCVEFFADKIPGIDTSWDALHTFIRIPAGAMLAAGAIGDVGPAWELAAAIAGGGLATTTHATKAGSRMLINTSPEPFTNWGASIGEDALVLAGLWTALNHPWLFIILLILFIAFAAWVLPKLWRLIVSILKRIGRFFGWVKKEEVVKAPEVPAQNNNTVERLEKLHKLKQDGALTEKEFASEKARLLDR